MVTLPSDVPVILATDGIKDVLTVVEINQVMKTVKKQTPNAIVGALMDEIQRLRTQKDDISIFVRGEARLTIDKIQINLYYTNIV